MTKKERRSRGTLGHQQERGVVFGRRGRRFGLIGVASLVCLASAAAETHHRKLPPKLTVKKSEREAPADPADMLRGVEQGLSQSKQRSAALLKQRQQVQQEIAALRTNSVAIARRAQDNETALADLQSDYHALTIQAAEANAALAERQTGQATLLAALQRVAILPPEALVFMPGSPIDAERSALLLGSVVPVLRQEAAGIAANLEQLRRVQDQIDTRRHEISDKQTHLNSDRLKLNAVLIERRKLDNATRDAATVEQQRQAALLSKATDLRDLMRKIEAEREAQLKAQQEQEDRARQASLRLGDRHNREVHRVIIHPPPSDAPPIRLTQPVAGRIVKDFGEGDDFSTTKGISLQGTAGATVVAPLSGRVMFAGTFKGYGQILIIDHGGGYHSLLAGLDRVQSAVGQTLVAGEPIGTMSTSGNQTLYLELRWQGQPIDPKPALSKRD